MGTPYEVKTSHTVWNGEKIEMTSKSYLSLFVLVETVKMADRVVREMMGL